MKEFNKKEYLNENLKNSDNIFVVKKNNRKEYFIDYLISEISKVSQTFKINLDAQLLIMKYLNILSYRFADDFKNIFIEIIKDIKDFLEE